MNSLQIKVCLYIYLFLIVSSFSISAQVKNKPVFSNIEFVSYEITKKGELDLQGFTQIDLNGLIKKRSKMFKGIEYSTSQLDNEQIILINRFLSGKKMLNSYIVKNKLDEGTHYAGSYSYLRFKLLDGTTDAVCYVTPLMSDDFKEFHQQLIDILNKNKKKTYTPASTDISKLSKEVLAEHRKSTYMPAIEIIEIERLH